MRTSVFPGLEFAKISGYAVPVEVFLSDNLNSALFVAYTNISTLGFKATEYGKDFTCLTHSCF